MTKPSTWKANPGDADYDEMRNRMLAAASEIVCEKGVAALRLDAMARRAGIALDLDRFPLGLKRIQSSSRCKVRCRLLSFFSSWDSRFPF